MLWIIPAWVVSCIAVFLVGYHYRGIVKKVESLEAEVKLKIDRPVVEPEVESELIDPLDEVQTAIYERDQLMKRLNPNEK